jgi:hypothetical protein
VRDPARLPRVGIPHGAELSHDRLPSSLMTTDFAATPTPSCELTTQDTTARQWSAVVAMRVALLLNRASVAWAEWDTWWVIPTMWLVGLAIGRWWAIPLGALGWMVLVVVAGPIAARDLPLAAALGAANVAVGILVRWAVVRLVRGITRLVRAV